MFILLGVSKGHVVPLTSPLYLRLANKIEFALVADDWSYLTLIDVENVAIAAELLARIATVDDNLAWTEYRHSRVYLHH